MNFGEMLEIELKRTGMSRKAFTDAVGIPPGSIAIWKNRGSYPRSEVVSRIAHVLRTTSDDLLSRTTKYAVLPTDPTPAFAALRAIRDQVASERELVEKLDSATNDEFWYALKLWLIDNRTLFNGLTLLDDSDLFEVAALVDAKRKVKGLSRVDYDRTLKIPALFDESPVATKGARIPIALQEALGPEDSNDRT